MATMVPMALQQAGVGSLGGGGAGQAGGGQGRDNRAAIDTNAICIRDFDGSPSGWDQWVNASKSAMRSANPGVLELMNEAEKMTTKAKDDNFDLTMAKEEVQKMSGEHYNILSQYCTGEALTIVMGVATNFVAWQRLHKKFSPKTMARVISLMTEVAIPKAVRELQEEEEAITRVKKLESECRRRPKTSSTPTSTTRPGARRWWTSSGRGRGTSSR